MDSKLALILQTVVIILGGWFVLYAFKKFGWLRGLYEDKNRIMVLFGIVLVVVNLGVLFVVGVLMGEVAR